MSGNEPDEPKNKDSGKNDVGNRTMQLDAFVDEMQDTTGDDVGDDAVLAEILEREADGGAASRGGGMSAPIVSPSMSPGSPSMAPQVSMPPPLPPKRVPKWVYIVGISFVVLAVVLGVFVGQMFAPAPAADVGATETSPAGSDSIDTTQEETTEPEFVPLDLETVIVSGEEGEVGEDEGAAMDEPMDDAPPDDSTPPE